MPTKVSVICLIMFSLPFLKARHTCTPYHPEGTRVILDSQKTPLVVLPFFKVRFFSLDILEVLLKLTGFLGFGEGRKETTETSAGYHVCFDMWVWCAFLAAAAQMQPWVSREGSAAMSSCLDKECCFSNCRSFTHSCWAQVS